MEIIDAATNTVITQLIKLYLLEAGEPMLTAELINELMDGLNAYSDIEKEEQREVRSAIRERIWDAIDKAKEAGLEKGRIYLDGKLFPCFLLKQSEKQVGDFIIRNGEAICIQGIFKCEHNNDDIWRSTNANTVIANHTFLVDSLPDGDFDWITLWEGEARILVHDNNEDGPFEYHELGASSISVKRETDDAGVSVSFWIPNNAELSSSLDAAISEKFGVDPASANWGGDGEEGQFGSYYIDA